MSEYIDTTHAIVALGLAVLGGCIVGLCVGFRLADKNPPSTEAHAGRNPNPAPPGPPPVSQTRPKVRRHGPERTP